MFDKILTSIQNIGRFSEREKALFKGKITNHTLAKNTFLLKEGQVCQSVHFINEGAIRLYHIAESGDDITFNLFIENDWVFDMDSFVNQKPTKNTILTTEKCEVFELNIHDLHSLIAHSQTFLLLGKILHVHKESAYDTLTSPEDKYKYLLNHKPQLLQKFPLKQVASYLKMTPETLSRVRRKINHP